MKLGYYLYINIYTGTVTMSKKYLKKSNDLLVTNRLWDSFIYGDVRFLKNKTMLTKIQLKELLSVSKESVNSNGVKTLDCSNRRKVITIRVTCSLNSVITSMEGNVSYYKTKIKRLLRDKFLTDVVYIICDSEECVTNIDDSGVKIVVTDNGRITRRRTNG